MIKDKEHQHGPDEARASTHLTRSMIVEGIEALEQSHGVVGMFPSSAQTANIFKMIIMTSLDFGCQIIFIFLFFL